MDIFENHQIAEFYTFIRKIKDQMDAWKMVEIKLTAQGAKEFTSQDIANHIDRLFPKNVGNILLCNPREILAIVNFGPTKKLDSVTSKIGKSLPEYACTIEVDELQKGLTKIQLNLEDEIITETQLHEMRTRRFNNIFMIAEPDPNDRFKIKELAERRAEIIMCNTTDKIIEEYFKQAPNLLFLGADLMEEDGIDILNTILRTDTRAYIILVADKDDSEVWVNGVKKGAKGVLTKPLQDDKIDAMIAKCPLLSKMPV